MAISLFSAIYRRLAADASVAALVGTRIWDGISPDGVFPNITIEVEEQEDDSLDEKQAPHYDVTIAAAALTPAARNSLHTAIKAAVNRKRWTDQNIEVLSTLIVSENRSTDSELGNAEQTYHISEIDLSVIAASNIDPSGWPFDTDFNFAAGNLTGHDGWTTGTGSGVVSAVVVAGEGIGVSGSAANLRDLAEGAPNATGPWTLHMECVLGNADEYCDVALINDDGDTVASFSLQRMPDTNMLTWHVDHQGGTDGNGTVTLGGSALIVNLSLAANGDVSFTINSATLFIDTTVDGSESLITQIAISIVDSSIVTTARITRLYFGSDPTS